jgi:Protein of unknown function (DUF2800)
MADETHSPLGASGAERWLNCPGSFKLCQTAECVTSDHAELGTAAHILAAECINGNRDAWEFIGREPDAETGYGVGYAENEIDPDAVQEYVDMARLLLHDATKKGVEYVLGRNYRPNKYFWGTADLLALHEDRLVVADFKYGVGVNVPAEDNPQLLYYAWGAINELYDIDLPEDFAVELIICQPRAAFGEHRKVWKTTVGYVTKWAQETLLPGMERAIEGDETLAMGDHCQFCDAKLICPLMQDAFLQHDQPEPTTLADADLDKFYAILPQVKMFSKALEAKAQARLTEGAELTSAKLVAMRTTRTWKDGAEKALASELGEDAFKRDLKSPAQVEKLSARYKSFVAEWAYLPEATGYRVAPASDPAPAVNPNAELEKLSKMY